MFFIESEAFDFESLKQKEVRTLFGALVKIDRIIYDITKTTVIAISGTFIVRGIKVRGLWNTMGNPLEISRCFQLNTLFRYNARLSEIICQGDKNLFSLTQTSQLDN